VGVAIQELKDKRGIGRELKDTIVAKKLFSLIVEFVILCMYNVVGPKQNRMFIQTRQRNSLPANDNPALIGQRSRKKEWMGTFLLALLEALRVHGGVATEHGEETEAFVEREGSGG
jgi:hypothetical protein